MRHYLEHTDNKQTKIARKALLKFNKDLINSHSVVNPSFSVGYISGRSVVGTYDVKPLKMAVMEHKWKKWIGSGYPNDSFIAGFEAGMEQR